MLHISFRCIIDAGDLNSIQCGDLIRLLCCVDCKFIPRVHSAESKLTSTYFTLFIKKQIDIENFDQKRLNSGLFGILI